MPPDPLLVPRFETAEAYATCLDDVAFWAPYVAAVPTLDALADLIWGRP
jgi:hypothetical protein